jgi:uncharacterized membrane protein YfcA
VGAGGAILAVPAFLYLFGFSALEATTASLAVVAVSAATSAVPRLRIGQVRMKAAVQFWAYGLVGTFAGSQLAHLVPESALVVGFALLMVAAAVAMWRSASTSDAAEPHGHPWWVLPLAALGVGVLTGLFGVGGGFLVVPALVLVFGLPFGVAAATSLVVISLNSVTALLFKYAVWPDVDWRITAIMTVAGVVVGVVSSRLAHRVPQDRLKRAFAVLLLLVAVWMAVETVALSAG